MRIMVFDVPAIEGGALTVLNEYYHHAEKDFQNEYIFILSTVTLKETKNVKTINYPWIKKSWFHRLFFDYIVAPKIIKKLKIDKVHSLQNTCIPLTTVPQTVLIHNALPFSEYRFSLAENTQLWIYQNLISIFIRNSCKKAESVIVQTEWMKNKCIANFKINPEKVIVEFPEINIEENEKFRYENKNTKTFFYPASGVEFKNHKLIVSACLNLKRQGVNNYRILFTLDKNESDFVRQLHEIIEKNSLPIEFLGRISKEEVYKLYTKSILIFPSYIETVGLPLIEAKHFDTPILSSNNEYALEVLKEYKNVDFFNPFNSEELSEKIHRFLI